MSVASQPHHRIQIRPPLFDDPPRARRWRAPLARIPIDAAIREGDLL